LISSKKADFKIFSFFLYFLFRFFPFPFHFFLYFFLILISSKKTDFRIFSSFCGASSTLLLASSFSVLSPLLDLDYLFFGFRVFLL